ncbi:kidney mitochondrial carrier protein 1-like isoform X1 [Clavelina lepadiformis]|uniref:kidney mitochondrial carrier protein 1-like isoform X1 n=1 Tax=Clavelina lepadiformis TaxID=159417 RepID=UPI004042B955
MAWEEHWIRPYFVGSVASVAAEIVTFPLDLAKTRLQIQGQVLDAKYTKLYYGGPVHTIRKIKTQQGLTMLYSGLVPALLRQSCYGALKLGFYQSAKAYTSKTSIVVDFALAFTSGAVAAVLCNPLDIVKVRMQTQGTPFTQTFKNLIGCDFFKEYFRGVLPNICRTGAVVGTTFAIYDRSKQVLICNFGFHNGVISYTISAFIACLVGAIVTMPFDVVKSRLMNQGRNSVRYRGVRHCISETWRNERFFAFYKGGSAFLIRAIPWHLVVSFVFKILICKMFLTIFIQNCKKYGNKKSLQNVLFSCSINGLKHGNSTIVLLCGPLHFLKNTWVILFKLFYKRMNFYLSNGRKYCLVEVKHDQNT